MENMELMNSSLIWTAHLSAIAPRNNLLELCIYPNVCFSYHNHTPFSCFCFDVSSQFEQITKPFRKKLNQNPFLSKEPFPPLSHATSVRWMLRLKYLYKNLGVILREWFRKEPLATQGIPPFKTLAAHNPLHSKLGLKKVAFKIMSPQHLVKLRS